MQYLGGKHRIAPQLAAIIRANAGGRTHYLEPFVGGGSMLIQMAPHFGKVQAGDIHPDLIMLWQALKDGWVPPTHISKEEYYQIKAQTPSALRGFVGFACSFGGKWWGGYAAPNTRNRSYALNGHNSCLKQAKYIGGVDFQCKSYRDWLITPDTVVYCDPPYVNTTGYKVAWDAPAFWDWARLINDQGAKVYVSELVAPLEWTCVWERSQQVYVNKLPNKIQTEKLFTLP